MITNAIANLLSSIQRQITIPPILTPYGETDGKIFLLLVYTLLLAGILSIGIFSKFRPLYLFLCTVMYLESGLIFGLAPSYWAGALLLSGWTIILILTIFSGKNLKSEKDKKRRSSKRIYCTGKVSPKVYCRGISILLVFVIVSSFWGAEKIIQIKPIKRPDFITQLRNDWKEGNFIPTEFFNLGFSQGKGGISAGRLGQYDRIHFENENHLKLTVGNTGNGAIYLRGYVGSRYTGNSWQQLPRKSYKEVKQLFEFGSSIQEISTERVSSMMAILSGLYDGKIVSQPFSETSVMEIENVGASRRWTYTPYFYYPTED